jgi:hypothetical protein
LPGQPFGSQAASHRRFRAATSILERCISCGINWDIGINVSRHSLVNVSMPQFLVQDAVIEAGIRLLRRAVRGLLSLVTLYNLSRQKREETNDND